MSSQNAVRSAIFAVIAGAVAGVIYEAIYFLTTNHQVRGGFITAAIVGAITFLIAFVLNLVFSRLGQRR
ncbi:MAG: hypothetical protein H0X24_20840 [Ktedonobacterales bacterium]|nr:hypothetical protein [Ktedonobacterales bacterium]